MKEPSMVKLKAVSCCCAFVVVTATCPTVLMDTHTNSKSTGTSSSYRDTHKKHQWLKPSSIDGHKVNTETCYTQRLETLAAINLPFFHSFMKAKAEKGWAKAKRKRGEHTLGHRVKFGRERRGSEIRKEKWMGQVKKKEENKKAKLKLK